MDTKLFGSIICLKQNLQAVRGDNALMQAACVEAARGTFGCPSTPVLDPGIMISITRNHIPYLFVFCATLIALPGQVDYIDITHCWKWVDTRRLFPMKALLCFEAL
eukprot:1140908-Pelagomonas_calceolata.AAC.2